MPETAEFELRIVEAMKPQPAPVPAKTALPKARRPAPTRAEALAALKATKGAEAVIKSIPQLEHTEVWGEAGYWTINSEAGIAANEPFLWDCDFMGVSWNMFDAYVNGIAYFSGKENFGGIVPPQTLTGQVWCYLDAPTPGYYLFVAQLETFPDEYYGPDYFAVVECLIDSSPFGEVTLPVDTLVRQPFVANLAPGIHRFDIRQIAGGVFFLSLTAWTIPILT
jgi:hypothetical protein